MNELLRDYVREVTRLLAALDADIGSRDVAAAVEWTGQLTALRNDLRHMDGMSADQLAEAIANLRPRLARLGALYLHVSHHAHG
jgi:hypothetical protein